MLEGPHEDNSTAREHGAVPHHEYVVLGMPDVEETFPKHQPVC